MKAIGEKLKAKREENGLLVDEVADDLKFRISQINNIEEGNVSAFKDVFYLKYFIRDYAKYLGLDVDETINEFNEFLFDYTSKIPLEDIEKANKELEKEKKTEENLLKSPYTQDKRKKWYKNKYLYMLLFIIIIIIILISIYKK